MLANLSALMTSQSFVAKPVMAASNLFLWFTVGSKKELEKFVQKEIANLEFRVTEVVKLGDEKLDEWCDALKQVCYYFRDFLLG